MFEGLPMIEILTLVVVVEGFFCGWCYWRWKKCCRKANEAWAAAKLNFDWIVAFNNEALWDCVTDKEPFKSCIAAGPAWPPKSPERFPPPVT